MTPSEKGRSKHPHHSALLYNFMTHASTPIPQQLSSTLHDTSSLLNARSAPTHSRPPCIPTQQIPLLYSQGDEANVQLPSATLPPSLAFGPSHIPRGHFRNVAHLFAAAPVPPNRPSMNNGRPTYGNGYFQSFLAQPTPRPLQIAAPPQSAETFTFIGENPADLDTRRKKRPRTEAHGEAVRSTIGAGGACVWCQARKKGCGSEVPCKSCAQYGNPCIRGSASICLASTIKTNAGRRRLDPDNFQRARDIMTQLKNEIYPPSGMIAYTTVFVDWTLYPQQYHRTWIVEATKLDLHQPDTEVQASLINLALGFLAVSGVESSEFPDPLNQSALKMAKLLAAIHQLYESDISVQPMAVGVARMTVFFLMAIYAMEMCNASVHFADELYTAIRNRKLAGRPEQHAIRVYNQVINSVMTLQHTGSLVSAIFAPIRPRLESLRDTVQRLALSPSKRKSGAKDTVTPDLSALKPFHIAIGLKSAVTGSPPTAGSRQEMRHDQLRYTVEFLLREDFDLAMTNGRSDPETIDPYLLSPEMAPQTTTPSYEYSDNVYSGENLSNIFTSAVEGSQNTDITYTHPDGTVLYPSPFGNATAGYVTNSRSYTGGPFGKGNYFSNMGTHFSH